MIPQIEQQIPSRDKLQLQLDNDMRDVTERLLERYKLPFRIVVADGLTEYAGTVQPEGRLMLVDTLSPGELHLQNFITVEPSTIQMKEDARRMSKVSYEVLIMGDTGTGKETIASSMIAARKGFVKAVNCAGLPSELIESELFGHKAGSFTGSGARDKDGIFTAARDGVCFLDEIGELPMAMQSKLLRALQEKRIRKIGSLVEEEINCKFVCATNRNLKKMVDEGTFRKDLYARISTLELHIKPLQGERRCDILPIARHVIETLKVKSGLKFLEEYGKDLQDGTIDVPLNVRSIQQYVVRFETLGRIK